VILASLGTHEQPMPRLTEVLGQLPRRMPHQAPFVIQHGYSPVPVGWSGRPLFGTAELEQLMREASIVICHAGPATVAGARASGRIPVVIPRQHRFAEHVDDHQLWYARRLAAAGEVLLVEDVAVLVACVERYEELCARLPPPVGLDPSPAIRRFVEEVDQLEARAVVARTGW
jgi:UDP-N-acetylglucosamine transferase subunit ALG13